LFSYYALFVVFSFYVYLSSYVLYTSVFNWNGKRFVLWFF